MLRVRYTMTRNVITIAPEDTLSDAYEVMRAEGIRHLPVVEGTSLVGILSDRDVLLRAHFDGDYVVAPEDPVYSAMSTNLVNCGPRTSIADASRMMIEHKISSLPVVETDGSLVGLVTATDLLDLLCQSEEFSKEDVLPYDFTLQPKPTVVAHVESAMPHTERSAV